MREILIPFLLTLVIASSLSWGAPSTRTSLPSRPYSAESDPTLVARPETEQKKTSRYLLSLGTGYSGGHYLNSDLYSRGSFFSFRFLPLSQKNTDWDYSFELHESDIFFLGVGKRWYCCEDDPYKPYARIAGSLVLHSKDELAGMVEVKRWRAQGGLGVGQSLFAETGAGVSITGTDLYLLIGLNLNF